MVPTLSCLSSQRVRWLPSDRHCRRQTNVASAAPSDQGALTPKTLLRELSQRAERGVRATSTLRSEIEETQVSLEGLSDDRVDFNKLEGKWRLIYTNARDVLPVLFLGRSPFGNGVQIPWPVKVGAIYQQFSSPDEGAVKNIIRLGFDNIFEEEGITVTVHARYRVCGPKRIALNFQKAEISDLKISPLVESVLAPALLPRTGFNHQLLLGIREFSLSIPLRQQSVASSSSARKTAGYLLTFLDDDMLIGRPLDQGGTFIFNKESNPNDA